MATTNTSRKVMPEQDSQRQTPRKHAPFMSAELQSKHPYRSAWLVIWHHRDLPEALVADLAGIGFAVDAQRQDPVLPGAPRVKGEPRETVFFKKGSDLFNGWTDRERKQNLSQVRAVLRTHDLHPGSLRRLALSDLL